MEGPEGDENTSAKQQLQCPAETVPQDGSLSKSPKPYKASKKTSEKRTDRDFIFGKIIGEGSFSCVYLAKDIHTHQEYAVKTCEKNLIKQEKKVESIMREKDVMNLLNTNHNATAPFFVKLSYAFQSETKLYFAMTYCKNGELLTWITFVGNFDEEASRFYTAEIVRALEHLHSLNVIHRDLKPENILLDENMHIKISDFGSAKILNVDETDSKPENGGKRRVSFVGTAQYVSPDILESRTISNSSDLWALGCIIYQLVSGLPPFRSSSDYLIFKKILKLEYEFPEGFCDDAKNLVQKLLVIDSNGRLGATDTDGYPSIRAHPFLADVNLDSLHLQTPPKISTFTPQLDNSVEWQLTQQPGLEEQELEVLQRLVLGDTRRSSSDCSDDKSVMPNSSNISGHTPRNINRGSLADVPPEEFKERLNLQEKENVWHRFVEGNLILKQGLLDKRKGLFPRRRMFLLTTGPHLYYVDPANMVLKGQIPWDPTIVPEPKNFNVFFVHTPNRTYYLEDPNGASGEWCQAIIQVKEFYFENSS